MIKRFFFKHSKKKLDNVICRGKIIFKVCPQIEFDIETLNKAINNNVKPEDIE